MVRIIFSTSLPTTLNVLKGPLVITPAGFFHLGHFQRCHRPSQTTTGHPSPHGQDLNLLKSCTARRISRRVLSINSSKSGLQHSSHMTTSLPLPTTVTSTRRSTQSNLGTFRGSPIQPSTSGSAPRMVQFQHGWTPSINYGTAIPDKLSTTSSKTLSLHRVLTTLPIAIFKTIAGSIVTS